MNTIKKNFVDIWKYIKEKGIDEFVLPATCGAGISIFKQLNDSSFDYYFIPYKDSHYASTLALYDESKKNLLFGKYDETRMCMIGILKQHYTSLSKIEEGNLILDIKLYDMILQKFIDF